MEDVNKRVGKRINKLRKSKKMSLDSLSKKTGFGISTISRYEKGVNDMPIDKLDVIAKALNTSVPFLMYGEEAEPQTEKHWVVKTFTDFDTEKFKAELSENPNLIGIVKGIVNNYDDDDFQIPLFSSISCGNIQSIDNILIDTVSVPNRLKKRYGSDVFAVRARGDSMNNVILDGHIAVFAKTEWQNGDAVIVMLNKEEATLKRITKTNYAILLEPDSTNKEHKPVFIDCVGNDCDVEVIGKLIHTYCDFE